MPLRHATLDDTPTLAGIYRDSAHGLGAAAYSPAQIEAWASFADDAVEFRTRLQRGVSLVSLEGDEIAAFGQLDPDDCLSLLYTAPRFARRGHASALCGELERIARERGVARLHTTASYLSRPLFENRGFMLTEVERKMIKGVEFERFKMAKQLGGAI